jgi:hypothetical protein
MRLTKELAMKLIEQVTQSLELVVPAVLMVWTLGTAVALLTPPAHERQGVVEIYSLTPVVDGSTGA